MFVVGLSCCIKQLLPSLLSALRVFSFSIREGYVAGLDSLQSIQIDDANGAFASKQCAS